MVEDLCFHLVDLVQNSVAAGARVIRVQIRESRTSDTLELEVADDGRGMDGPTLLKVQDPFFTSKSFKKVGLGIPLLKATTEACRGDFAISSRLGHGTRIRASMQRSHLDCPPLGDLEGTLLSLLVSLDTVDLRFSFHSGRKSFAVSSAEARAHAGDLPLSHPDVYRFLREFIRAGLEGLLDQSP
jgi:hypothetical protein